MSKLSDLARKAGLAGSEAPSTEPDWTYELRPQDIAKGVYCGYVVLVDYEKQVTHQCNLYPGHSDNHVCRHANIAW